MGWCNYSYCIDTIYRNSDPVIITNKRFNLAMAFETLKHRLSIYSDEGSGWIVDEIEDIWIHVANYDPLIGSRYFLLQNFLYSRIKKLYERVNLS